MSIDLDVEMIVPQQSEQSVPEFKDVSVIVNHFVKNGGLIKRVEALGREAAVFNGAGNEIENRYKTEFNILNAFFVTFTPKTPEDYLCLIGNDQIDFYSQDANCRTCCPIALPFKICRAHSCSFGIILERSSFPGEHGNLPGAAQLFSLTHPYNEIMPILCKFKGDSDCHYTFRGKRMAVIPKEIAANWCSSFFGPVDLLMCYDIDERRNNLFLIRKCTKEERLAAKNDLGVLNSSALMHTPSTVRSFYSPNFFNRRFAEDRLASIGLLNPQKNNIDTHLHHSPANCFNSVLFANSNGSSHLHAASQTSASLTSSIPSVAPSKTPITRRITRSMAAAAASGEFSNPNFGMGALSSLPSSAADKSGSFHRSLEHNAALNRMRLKQKFSITSGNNIASNAYINNSTPRHAHSFSAVDMDDLLSFGGRETDAEPPSSLNMAVEFCLDWLWSEPLPPPIDDAVANRSGSTSSIGTEKVAQKLETLRVSSSTSSQSEEAANKINNANRMASTFFISRQALSRSERCIVFHISSDRRVVVLNIHFPKALEDSSSILVPDPIITENGSPSSFIRGDSAVPFLHAPFFMVLVNFSFTDSPTAFSIALYTGCTKIANIALNFGIPRAITSNACSNLLRLLPGGLCANGYNQYALRVFVKQDNSHMHQSPVDDAFRNASFTLFSFKFQLGFNTKLANRCLMTICSWIGIVRQLQFLSRLFCSNPWKITNEAQKIPFVDELPIECIELALLFEHVFEDFCYPQKDMPFQKLLARIRSNEDDGEKEKLKEHDKIPKVLRIC
uniref:Uncharacterized protein n=1 Tax=Meloidogyne enterolobii TaxID=390850 RepID=A0A6V7VG75_MELEN|nr:unnamed protein product [Meloidogyne enterolobii]